MSRTALIAGEGSLAPTIAAALDRPLVYALDHLHPQVEAKPFRLERLVEAIRTVLEAAIAAGGSSIRDYARPDGELGYFSKQWRVYGREGDPCGCGATVRRRAEGGRSTFWCPVCQRG